MNKQELYLFALRHVFSSFVNFSYRELHRELIYQQSWHMQVLAQHLSRACLGDIPRLLVNSPPEGLASFAAMAALPAWYLGRNPNARVLCLSASLAAAKEMQDYSIGLMRSARYRAVFPHIKVNAVRRIIVTEHGGQRIAATTFRPQAVKNIDLIICDNLLLPELGQDPGRLSELNTWFDDHILRSLSNDKQCPVIVTMSRSHRDDLSGHLGSGNSDWVNLVFAALAMQDEVWSGHRGKEYQRLTSEPLDPNIMDRAAMREKLIEIGAFKFATLYQQKPNLCQSEDGDLCGAFSDLRDGVRWRPEDGNTNMWFGQMSEVKVLLHTVFGEGEHPCPPDMRMKMTQEEWDEFYGPMADNWRTLRLDH